jgi:hypothetical protein
MHAALRARPPRHTRRRREAQRHAAGSSSGALVMAPVKQCLASRRLALEEYVGTVSIRKRRSNRDRKKTFGNRELDSDGKIQAAGFWPGFGTRDSGIEDRT